MNSSICKVCNRSNLKKVISFKKYPSSISFLFNSRDKALKNFAPLHFNQCLNCNHIQIGTDTPQSFYEDYIMTVSHSNKMKTFQNEQAKFFINKYSLQNKKLLEVGCGDGNFSLILKELHCQVFCNEPSQPFRELAIQNGLEVDDKFIDFNYKHSKAPFDAIVSREVMEHVPNPIDFLVSLRNLLKNDGKILIEVPNFEKTLQQNRYYDLFPDHLSYFTKESLTAAMLISGYKNIEIYYGMEDEFIYAIAENLVIDTTSIVNSIELVANAFNEITKKYHNIVIWGAGGKGISAMGSLSEISAIKYVVDSDAFKQGKYIPSSGLLVCSPEVLYADSNIDLLIITNLAYTDEIVSLLKQNNFQSKIMILSKSGISELKLN